MAASTTKQGGLTMNNISHGLSEVSDEVFALVARELATGKPDEALWTKAFALQNGNESATKAHYIRLRAEQIQRAASGRIEAENELAADAAPHIAGPWARYFARYLDLVLSVCLTLLLFLLLMPTIKAANVQMSGPFWVTYLLVICSVALLPWVIDAAIVTLFGNSLGKAIWGITVRHNDGRPLTFKEALNRNFLVALYGFWTGMTPLSFIPHIISYKKLKNEGATSWDAKGNYEVLSSDPGAFRKIVGIALLFVALLMLAMMEFGANLYAQKTKIDTTSAKPGLDNGRLEAQTLPSTPPEKEIAELSKRAEAGDAAAQVKLATKYLTGLGVPPDSTKAFNWFQKAAVQGNAAAQHNLGFMYGTGNGRVQDDTKAFEWYQKAALQGFSASQFSIGECYYFGTGVNQDIAKAFEWYQKAAAQRSADAQWRLGHMYKIGKAVPQDSAKAFEWFQKAAEQGNPEGQNSLGVIYEQGKEFSKAFEWYQKAAAQGNDSAQFNLGAMYHLGKGMPKDYSRAVEWYEKAAAQGNASAQNNLGSLYYQGLGVLKDNVLAYAWANLAARSSVEVASTSRSEVEKDMTVAEVAEAQRLSASWKIGQLLSR